MSQLFRPTAQLKISLTPDCNNDCPICLNKTTRSGNGKESMLSIDKIKELIDEAAALGMVGTYWTGGEPLIEYKNLIKLMRYSSKQGLISTIVTNGGLIGAYGNYKEQNHRLLEGAGLLALSTSDIVKSLKEAGLVRVYFSVDNSHTTLESADSDVYNSVPSEVVSKAISAFLNEGFGKIHELDAIGYQLRVTATSSGLWKGLTDRIIEEVMKSVGVNPEKQLSANTRVYGNEKGKILLKYLHVSNIGAAEVLGNEVLEDRSGINLFNARCSHFVQRDQAYDNGRHHGDLFVDYNGIVYTCGDHAFPVGNVSKESLSSIIKGINTAGSEGDFGLTRRVFHSLLLLSKDPGVGNNAIGEAFRLIYSRYPELIQSLKTQCGACNCLGNRKDLQEAFLEVTDGLK